MTAIEPPFTQHWSWHLNQRKPFSSELDQFSIRINFAFQSIAVFKKRNYFTCYFPHNLNNLQFVNIVTASIRFGIQLVGSECEGWKEKVQHHLSSPAKTNGTLIHLIFLFFIFLHLLYSLSSLSLSFPPLSLSPISSSISLGCRSMLLRQPKLEEKMLSISLQHAAALSLSIDLFVEKKKQKIFFS